MLTRANKTEATAGFLHSAALEALKSSLEDLEPSQGIQMQAWHFPGALSPIAQNIR